MSAERQKLVVDVVLEALQTVLQLESTVKRYRISTEFIWMMQGYSVCCTLYSVQ